MQQNKGWDGEQRALGFIALALCGVNVCREGDAGRAVEYGVFPCGLRVMGGQTPEHLEFSFGDMVSMISVSRRGAGKPTIEKGSLARRMDG